MMRAHLSVRLLIAAALLTQTPHWGNARGNKQTRTALPAASLSQIEGANIYKSWTDREGVFDRAVTPSEFQRIIRDHSLQLMPFSERFRKDVYTRFLPVLSRYSDHRNFSFYDVRKALPIPSTNGAYIKVVAYSWVHRRMFVFFYWPNG